MEETERLQYEFARQLVARLERLSVDSTWAHRASGLRGSILRCMNEIETQNQQFGQEDNFQRLNSLIESGFQILKEAAKTITVPEDIGSS